MTQLFWLSFCDAARPEGTQFLGAAAVEAPSLLLAVPAAWKAGVNPGGEVQITEIPADLRHRFEACLGRLLTKEDVAQLDAEWA